MSEVPLYSPHPICLTLIHMLGCVWIGFGLIWSHFFVLIFFELTWLVLFEDMGFGPIP